MVTRLTQTPGEKLVVACTTNCDPAGPGRVNWKLGPGVRTTATNKMGASGNPDTFKVKLAESAYDAPPTMRETPVVFSVKSAESADVAPPTMGDTPAVFTVKLPESA